jgi:hypothetical protein
MEPGGDGDANHLSGKLVADDVNVMPSVPLSLHESPNLSLPRCLDHCSARAADN